MIIGRLLQQLLIFITHVLSKRFRVRVSFNSHYYYLFTDPEPSPLLEQERVSSLRHRPTS